MEKKIKSRIVHKHDTETNWSKATNFIPKQGEIIVYDIDETHAYERFKIGDGTSLVTALPFVNDKTEIETMIQNLTNSKEDKSNKITSLSSSSTDIQYPSAKSVVDYVSNKISNVYKFKSVMPSTGIYDTPEIGDVYNISSSYTDGLSSDFIDYVSTVNIYPYDGYFGMHIDTDILPPPNEWTVFKFYIDEINDIDNGIYYSQLFVKDIIYEGDGNYYFNHLVDEYGNDVNIAAKDDYSPYVGNVSEFVYTPSVNVGDNIVWTGYYWDKLAGVVDLSGVESKLNKTTTVSSYSTNEQYPSAKSVYDFVENKISNVYKFKGSISSIDIPQSGISVGDVYNMVDTSFSSFTTEDLNISCHIFYDGELYLLNGNANQDNLILNSLSSGDILYTPTLGGDIILDYYDSVLCSWVLSYTRTLDMLLNGESSCTVTSISYTITHNAGDNIAWIGHKWDLLSGIVSFDTSDLASIEYVDTKVNSIYRFKGSTATNRISTITTSEIGDVYNIVNNGTITLSIAVSATCDLDKIVDSDGTEISGKQLVYIYDSSIISMINVGDTLTIDGINVVVEDITLSATGTGTYTVNTGTSTLSAGALTKIKYVLNLNASDNIAWTGYRWDKLASSINLNPY